MNLYANGFYATPRIHFDADTLQGEPLFYFTCGVAVCEVSVDTSTGEHRLLRVDILQDVGHSLDQVIDLGQVEGAFNQGMGWLTTEELVWSEAGELMTRSPFACKIPTAADKPPVFNVRPAGWSQNPAETVLRTKGIGEPPRLLANAVIWPSPTPSGVPCGQLNAPATPEEVPRALTNRSS